MSHFLTDNNISCSWIQPLIANFRFNLLLRVAYKSFSNEIWCFFVRMNRYIAKQLLAKTEEYLQNVRAVIFNSKRFAKWAKNEKNCQKASKCHLLEAAVTEKFFPMSGGSFTKSCWKLPPLYMTLCWRSQRPSLRKSQEGRCQGWTPRCPWCPGWTASLSNKRFSSISSNCLRRSNSNNNSSKSPNRAKNLKNWWQTFRPWWVH